MSIALGPVQWKVVPMGAKHGNAAFQRMREDLLQPFRDCTDTFVDDVLIGSGTGDMADDELIEAHEGDLRRVLGVLNKHSMVSSQGRTRTRKTMLKIPTEEKNGNAITSGNFLVFKTQDKILDDFPISQLQIRRRNRRQAKFQDFRAQQSPQRESEALKGNRSPCVTRVANTTSINAAWINSGYNIVVSDCLQYRHASLENRIMYHSSTQLRDALNINFIGAELLKQSRA